MIEQFINQAVSQLGISQHDAEEATSGLLSLLQQQAGSGDFSALLSKVGGAEALMNKFSAGTNLAGGDAGGLMGGLMGAVGGMLGNSGAGSLANVAALVSQINLDTGQLGSLASLFFNFIKSEAGESLANNLMGELGGLLKAAA